jgi:hypothetical protein
MHKNELDYHSVEKSGRCWHKRRSAEAQQEILSLIFFIGWIVQEFAFAVFDSDSSTSVSGKINEGKLNKTRED